MKVQQAPGTSGDLYLRPDAETPFRTRTGALQLTQAEMDGVTAFLRELKPGIYVKCTKCERMKYNEGSISFQGDHMVLCGECA